MLNQAAKLYKLLLPNEQRHAILLMLMIVLMGFFEMIGVASVIPFVSLLADPTIVERNSLLREIYRFSDFGSPESFLFVSGILVLVLLVASIAFRAVTYYAIVRFTSMRSFTLSSRLVSGYLQRPYEWFLNHHSADLGKTILNEVDQVVRGAMLPFTNLLAGLVTSLFILSLLLWANGLLAITIAFTLTFVYVISYVAFSRTLKRISQDRGLNNRKKYQIVADAFGGIKEIKVTGLENTFFKWYQTPTRHLANSDALNSLISSMPKYFLEAVAFGGMLIIALYVMRSSGDLKNAVPTLALYALAGYRLMPMMQQVYQSAVSLRYAAAAIDNLCQDFSEQNENPASNLSAEPIVLQQKIELTDVSYRYPNASKETLSNINIAIQAYSTVALVGCTGSGKTTLVDIILGLLQPTNGALTVDSVNVTKESTASWQKSLAYVPQQIFLIDDTIAANVAFGVPKALIEMNRVEEVSKIACLHDFVVSELDNGYQTMVGERGVRLSGGQRQRIGIARALYRQPHLLVLDEATSALDNVTEERVMTAIRQLTGKMTIIMIAHRLSSVRLCDSIFVVDSGCVIEHGTFNELAATSVRFQELANSYKAAATFGS